MELSARVPRGRARGCNLAVPSYMGYKKRRGKVTPVGSDPGSRGIASGRRGGVDWSAVLYAQLREAGIRHFVHVPDTPLSRLIGLAGADPEAVLLPATREEEGVGIAAGVSLGGGGAALLMQTSGLGNALNALGSLALAYQIPLLMVISMRGEAGEWNAAQVPVGRATPRILEALGIPHATVTAAAEIPEMTPRLASLAFRTGTPAALLLSRRLTGRRPA